MYSASVAALASLIFLPGDQSSVHTTYCTVLKRPLSWDPYGAYSLDKERPLTKAGAEIVKDLQEAELGRAELLARYRLLVDKDDLVPAWALAQIVRVKKGGLAEYHRAVEGHGGDPASLPVRLFRFHVCRLALKDLLENHRSDPGAALFWSLDRDLKSLREACRKDARNQLGVVVGLTNSVPFWVVSDREILRSYQEAHPKGPDVRPLLCRAYLNGVFEVDKAFKESPRPDGPRPEASLAVAQSILKDRPQDPYGLYYRGRSLFALKKTEAATRDVAAALATGALPPIFAEIAKAFLRNPSEQAFHSVAPVD